MAPRCIGVPGRLSCIVMVKNEEEYVGYSILSMLHRVDEMFVVDGGSTDGTLDIIRHVKNQYDHDNRMRISVDTRPKNELIHVRNDMIAECTGEWILRLEGDEVYDDKSAREVCSLLLAKDHDVDVLSAGWPYWFFAGDLEKIVEVGQPHTLATIAIRNVEGLHARHHDRGGNETFWDEGWYDADLKHVSVHHPDHHPSVVTHEVGVCHYAAFKRTTRHDDYLRTAQTVPFHPRHPEVFERYDFRHFMKNPDFVNPAEQARVRVRRARTPVRQTCAKPRILGNYLMFARDDDTLQHIRASALAFCEHTSKDIDLIVWDNESDPACLDAMRTIFEAHDWSSLEFRIVPKKEGGPGVGSLNQRVQRAIFLNALQRLDEFDFVFTQEDDYWYVPSWVEKACAIFAQHPDVDVVNPIDGPFLYSDCTAASWIAPRINPVVEGVVIPTLHNGRPLYLLNEEVSPRAVSCGAQFQIRFARHIDGSNWYRTSMLERLGAGMLKVIDQSYNGWPHFYDWCWPDFAMAEWLCDQGVLIACPRPSLHQHRTRPGKGAYESPTFPKVHERV